MKDWKYIVYLCILLGLLLLVVLSKEKNYDWRVTLAHEDKNPYGAYALNVLLSTRKKVEHRYKTFYELKDSLSAAGVLIMAERFGPTNEDTKTILNYVKDGGALFVAASTISGKFADTLQIQTTDQFFQASGYSQNSESAFLRLRSTAMDTTFEYNFKRQNIFSYLTNVDTPKVQHFQKSLLASNHNDQAVGLRIFIGKGSIVLSSTPLIFTNYCILAENNQELVSSLLSYVPQPKIYWTEYYQLGRLEITSPLRFILNSEPLRWAYYLAIGAVLIFIIIEIKRKQRVIPIVKPLSNTTVDFVTTIGGLYFESADHKSIAMKKILSFHEALRTKFYFTQSVNSPNYVQTLSLKSGVGEETVQQLVDIIHSVTTSSTISDVELRLLHQRIQDFWAK